ncbi:hypothetical protein ACP4OV_015309 [Aristida adscensionis]
MRRACQTSHAFAPEFATKPWVVQLGANAGPTRSFVNPFDGASYEAAVPAAQGKRCLGWHGEWLLMLDGAATECFLLHFASQRRVDLPPLPEPPDPDECFAFALSGGAAPPDCTVVLSVRGDRRLRHCRPGDTGWGRLGVFDGMDDELDPMFEEDSHSGAVVGHGGRVHLTTRCDMVGVLDAASSEAPRVESNDTTLPATCPLHHHIGRHLVESRGDIFYVRLYIQHRGRQRKVVNVDVHVKERPKDSWESVESIGGRAIFIGGHNSAVVTNVAEAGLQPNRIHVLGLPCDDGTPLYTISLDGMISIGCRLLQGLPGEGGDHAYWVVPTWYCFEHESSTKDNAGVVSCETSGSAGQEHGDEPDAVSTSSWSDLPGDLLELIVQEVSFLDALRLRAVCRDWSSVTPRPIQDAKSPLLLTTRARTEGGLATFDPMTGRKYDLGFYIHTGDPEPQALRCSRQGWVLLTEGEYCLMLVNPLKGLFVDLPPMDNHFFSGITFLSVPGSPDFMVVCVSDWRGLGTTTVRTWRHGQEDWTVTEFEYDVPFLFRTGSHNPVLLDDELYCLGKDGRLGVFNPSTLAWRILAKPLPLYDEIGMEKNEHCYLAEWKGQLIAIFTVPHGEPIRMFKLDRSQREWSVLEDLADAVLFLDGRDALAKPATRKDLGNRIYLQRFCETDVATHAVYYSVGSRRYCPGFYGNTEPVNAIWFEPKLRDL